MAEKQKIVVPTDFSEASFKAFDWVREYTRNNPAEVHCINVVMQPSMYMPTTTGTSLEFMPGVDDIVELTEKNLAKTMKQFADKFDEPPVTKVLAGRPADEICGYAKNVGATMIVISARGHSQLTHILLGDTAAGVVRHAECPVVTIKG